MKKVGIFKQYEIDGVKYYFSKKNHDDMMRDCREYRMKVDNEVLLMYCDSFDVV